MGITINDLVEQLRSERQDAAARAAADDQFRREQQRRLVEQQLAAWDVCEALGLGEVVSKATAAVATGRVELAGMAVEIELWAPFDFRQYGGLRFTLKDAANPNTSVSWQFGPRYDESREQVQARLAELGLDLLDRIRERRARDAAQEAQYRQRELARAAELERGRKGAEVLQRVAREYAEILASQAAAAKAWAESESARLWRPWSGWLVRYVPVGQRVEAEEDAQIERVFVLDDVADIVAESPGASVRVVNGFGRVEDRIIGAFLDAEPVEFEAHDCEQGMAYHRSVKAGPDYVVNVHPQETREPAPPPHWIGWLDYLAGRLGQETADSLWHSYDGHRWYSPEALAESSSDKLADSWEVQQLAEVAL